MDGELGLLNTVVATANYPNLTDFGPRGVSRPRTLRSFTSAEN